MIKPKSSQEIEIMRQAGAKLKRVIEKVIPEVKPGAKPKEIDRLAEEEILKLGGRPSFKTVKGYKWTICLPVNEQVVHTPPIGRVLKKGDVVTLDIGFLYKGYHVDYATTLYLGNPLVRVRRFLDKGREALEKALRKIKAGVYLGEVSQIIQTTIEGAGYSIIKELSGHGIGKSLHEDPFVLNFLDRPIEETLRLPEGLTIAVEVIYAMGEGKVEYEPDGWSIRTSDGSLSACFEHTIVVGKNRAEILI